MPALKNARHERFAQGLVKGMTADAAHEHAGFKPYRQNASRLMTKNDIQARVAELTQPAIEETQVTVERVLRELEAIAFADLEPYVTVNESGVRTVDLEKLPPAAVRVKLDALQKLGTHLRMWVIRHEHQEAERGIDEKTDEELLAHADEIARRRGLTVKRYGTGRDNGQTAH